MKSRNVFYGQAKKKNLLLDPHQLLFVLEELLICFKKGSLTQISQEFLQFIT